MKTPYLAEMDGSRGTTRHHLIRWLSGKHKSRRYAYLDRKALAITKASTSAIQDEEELVGNSMMMGSGAMVRGEDFNAEGERHPRMGEGVKDKCQAIGLIG